MVYINNELKSIFIHHPKCGGTYIETILKTFYNFKPIHFSNNTCGENKYNKTNIFLNNGSYKNIINEITVIEETTKDTFKTCFCLYEMNDSLNNLIKLVLQYKNSFNLKFLVSCENNNH
jgi:hypothetical protein